MANLIQDNLYRVALDSERNFVYVSARDKTDLIHFLAEEFAGKREVFGVKQVGTDGSLTTVPVITDEQYQRLVQERTQTSDANKFRVYLRQLQKDQYSWPNDYFAWEKPDGTLFMVGVKSGQYGHILTHEQEEEPFTKTQLHQLGKDLELPGPATYERRYVSGLYSISPTTVHMRSTNEGMIAVDPVAELAEKVSSYKYLGNWRDPDLLMPSPAFGRQLAHGRWNLAKEHILGREKRPALDNRICEAGKRAATPDPKKSKEKAPEPER